MSQFERSRGHHQTHFDRSNDLPIKSLLDNNPELAKIYGDRSMTDGIELNEKGMIVAGEHSYHDTPRMRFLVELADAIRKQLPEVPDNCVRLWRGNRPNEVGHNPSYTNSLEGIALPFLRSYKGVLSYVDIPKEEAATYLLTDGAAPDSEFILPPDKVANAQIVGYSIEEAAKIKREAQPESHSDTPDGGWSTL